MKGKIVVYEGSGGGMSLPFDAEAETIWATQAQIATLFGVDRTRATRHINNILKDDEVDEKSNVRKTHIAGADRPVNFYSLDMILAVGYRTNSKKAIQFRRWANSVLRKYIVEGVAVNEGRLRQLDVEKLRGVEGAMGVVRRLIAGKELDASEAGGVLEVLSRYAATWEVLERYDERRVSFGRGRRARWRLDVGYALGLVDEMRVRLGATELFGKVRDGGFEGVVGAVYQTFGGGDLYGTVAEKAANLLYLIIKDHPFYDGNKRIGAYLFVVFLTMNNFHLTEGGECKISDRALTAIALLIAESRPEEKELIVGVVGKLLEGK